MKPIIEARAKAQQIRKPESVSPKSDEQNSIRSDAADMLNVSTRTVAAAAKV
jgi:hypothetical protein